MEMELKQIKENAIAQRMSSPLAKNASDAQFFQIVALTFVRKGLPKDDNTIEFVASDFKNFIVEEFPYLTIEEVSFALKEGVFGKYGEYYGVSEATMVDWIRAYVVSDERINFIQKRNLENSLKALPPKREPSEQETKQVVIKHIQTLLDTYKKTHRYSSFSNFIYDYIDKLGVIETSNSEKWELYDRYYKSELENEKLAKQDKGKIISFKERVKMQQNNAKSRAIKKCKDFLTVRFFDEVIASGKDVQTFIDQQQKN